MASPVNWLLDSGELANLPETIANLLEGLSYAKRRIERKVIEY